MRGRIFLIVFLLFPLPVYTAYLLISGKLFGIAIPLFVFGIMAHFGLKMLKGKSAAEVAAIAVDRASRIDKDTANALSGKKE